MQREKNQMCKKVILVVTPIDLRKKAKYVLPPLGVLYLATVLRQNGVDVKIIDWNTKEYDIDTIKNIILEENPDVVGISAMTPHIPLVLKFAKALKNGNNSIKICLGGPHVNSTKDEIFKFTNDIDFVVYGEGENTLSELMGRLDDEEYSNVDGLIYSEGGKVTVNKPREFIQNLDRLPFPDLSLIDIDEYSIFHGKHKPVTSIMATRGCPYRCTFCDVYLTHGHKLRYRSPKNVVDELEHNYKNYGVKEVVIKDSTLTINRKWISGLCQEIKKRNLKLSWLCNTRVDKIDKELLTLMKKSGCRQISYGVESGSQEVLDSIKKGITIEQIKEAFEVTHKVGIETQAFFMIGNPGDNIQNVKKTIELAKDINPDYADIGATIAYPNTDLYKWGVKTGFLKDSHWYMEDASRAMMHIYFSNGQLNLPKFSPEEQVEYVKKAYKEFYFRTNYILKTLMKIHDFYYLKQVIKTAISLFFSLKKNK